MRRILGLRTSWHNHKWNTNQYLSAMSSVRRPPSSSPRVHAFPSCIGIERGSSRLRSALLDARFVSSSPRLGIAALRTPQRLAALCESFSALIVLPVVPDVPVFPSYLRCPSSLLSFPSVLSFLRQLALLITQQRQAFCLVEPYLSSLSSLSLLSLFPLLPALFLFSSFPSSSFILFLSRYAVLVVPLPFLLYQAYPTSYPPCPSCLSSLSLSCLSILSLLSFRSILS